MTWIDNFNLAFGVGVQKLTRNSFKALNMTGFAVVRQSAASKNVDVLLQADTSSTPFFDQSDEMNAALHSLKKALNCEFKRGFTRYQDSFQVKMGINAVPVKPKQSVLRAQFPKWLPPAGEQFGSLSHFLPQKIIDVNCSSNAGLALIMRQFFDDRVVNDNGQCKLIVCDVALFEPIHKVRHDFVERVGVMEPESSCDCSCAHCDHLSRDRYLITIDIKLRVRACVSFDDQSACQSLPHSITSVCSHQDFVRVCACLLMI